MAASKRDRLKTVWRAMHRRCHDFKAPNATSYALKGIKVCDEWTGKDGYLRFREWALANGYDYNAPKRGCTIDRINGDGNYEPSNCRWVSVKVQSNNRTSNRFIAYNGETHTLAEWADKLGISQDTLYTRIGQRHWPIERALSTPIRKVNNTISYKGEELTISEWSKKLAIPRSTFLYHLNMETDKEKVIEYFTKRKETQNGRTEK
jgi:hypothetical protein